MCAYPTQLFTMKLKVSYILAKSGLFTYSDISNFIIGLVDYFLLFFPDWRLLKKDLIYEDSIL